MARMQGIRKMEDALQQLKEEVEFIEGQLQESKGSNAGPSIQYFSSTNQEMIIHQGSGILMYKGWADDSQIGQFISAQPLTEDYPSFSFKIINQGKKCDVAIGVCPKGCSARMPGYDEGTTAYHSVDGGIYDGQATKRRKEFDKVTCQTGDVLECQLDFSNGAIMFFRNGDEVCTLDVEDVSELNELHAAVGMRSRGQAVQLLETEPWRH